MTLIAKEIASTGGNEEKILYFIATTLDELPMGVPLGSFGYVTSINAMYIFNIIWNRLGPI